MKKKAALCSLLLISAVLLLGVIWYKTPVRFLKNVEANEITYIEVFNGNTGAGFRIDREQDISYIVSNIQNAAMIRDKLSLNYDGFMFKLRFYSSGGNLIDDFTVNWENTIRADPFFYRDPESSLCVDYLKTLEEASKE